eukprot:scaffold7232_cov63-Cyclotella_meneghiniana.AAC.1
MSPSSNPSHSPSASPTVKWDNRIQFNAADGESGDGYGHSVGVSDDTIIVGAPYKDESHQDSGAAYILKKNENSGAWEEIQKITASDSDAIISGRFGMGVAVSEEVAVVCSGGNGAAYVFEFDDNHDEWVETDKLTPPYDLWRGYCNSYSNELAVSGRTIVAGSYYNNAVHIFNKNENTGKWVEEQKLHVAINEWFGLSVGMSGNVILVGAPNSNGSFGSAYVYEFNNSSGLWEKMDELSPKDTQDVLYFGFKVAVFENIIVIGAPHSKNNIGLAYIFEKNITGSWVEAKRLEATDYAYQSALFGYSVGVFEDYAVIGCYQYCESAYLYHRDSNGNWDEIPKKLLTEKGARGVNVGISDNAIAVGKNGSVFIFETNIHKSKENSLANLRLITFGQSVGVSDYTIVVGAPYKDGNRGATYILQKNESSGAWGEIQKISAGDAAQNDQFGMNVALSKNVAVVCGSNGDGAAYVFEYDETHDEWLEKDRLPLNEGSGYCNYWSNSLAVSGKTIVAGSYYNNAVHIFNKNEDTGKWVKEQKLSKTRGYFGYSVGVSGNVIVVGSPYSNAYIGSAYVYEFNNSSGLWEKTDELSPKDNQSVYFGFSVGVFENIIVIGAPRSKNGIGLAYIFEKNITESWVEVKRLEAPDYIQNSFFGESVGVFGDYAVIGCRHYCGSAYLFHRDLNGNWDEIPKKLQKDYVDGVSVGISANTIAVGSSKSLNNGSVPRHVDRLEQNELQPIVHPTTQNDVFSNDDLAETAVVWAW